MVLVVDVSYYVQRPLCLQCYFRGTETHKHTRVHSQVTKCAHARIGTYSHNVVQTHTQTLASPDVVLESSLILSLSFASQPAQSVYPCLDKYTLAGGGVCFTHRVFWFNLVLQRLVAYSLQCRPLGPAWALRATHTLSRIK